MPGALYHLYFMKKTYAELAGRGILLNITKYAAGNIIPDMAAQKDVAHCYVINPEGFYIPDLLSATEKYSSIEDSSLALGVIGHLYLDAYFTRNAIAKVFALDANSGKIYYRYRKRHIGEPSWTVDEFFSFDRGIYHAYSAYNNVMLDRYYINMLWIESFVPYELPPSGIEVLDRRKEENWLDQLKARLKTAPKPKDEMLSFGFILRTIDRAAIRYADIIERAMQR